MTPFDLITETPVPTQLVKCAACDGAGTFAVTVPNTRKSGGVIYPVNVPPTVERLYPCEDCKGAGRMTLQRARRLAEQRRIDAEKAAFEATRPDYDQMADDRIAAGLTPW